MALYHHIVKDNGKRYLIAIAIISFFQHLEV